MNLNLRILIIILLCHSGTAMAQVDQLRIGVNINSIRGDQSKVIHNGEATINYKRFTGAHIGGASYLDEGLLTSLILEYNFMLKGFTYNVKYGDTMTNDQTVYVPGLELPLLLKINVTRLLNVHFGSDISYTIPVKGTSDEKYLSYLGLYDHSKNKFINFNNFNIGAQFGLEVELRSIDIGARFQLDFNRKFSSPVLREKMNGFYFYVGYSFGG